jgi:hypothetical protein
MVACGDLYCVVVDSGKISMLHRGKIISIGTRKQLFSGTEFPYFYWVRSPRTDG